MIPNSSLASLFGPTNCRIACVLGLVTLYGCTDQRVTGSLEQWECTESQCSVVLLLANESHTSRSFTFVLRAHKVRGISGAQGAFRNEVVGEFVGTAALAGREKTRVTHSFRVLGKPRQIELSVGKTDDR